LLLSEQHLIQQVPARLSDIATALDDDEPLAALDGAASEIAGSDGHLASGG
jgi:hypothetical protein